MKVLFCVLALVAAANAAENPLLPLAQILRSKAQAYSVGTRDVSANINEQVDQIMDGLGDFFADVGLDPLELPAIEEGFSLDLGLLEFHGELEITNGLAHDLSKVNRAGDATVNYDKKLLRLQMGLGFDAIKINYDYLARIMNIGPKGQIYADVMRTELHFDVLMDMEDFTFYLQNFEITKIGQIKVNFKGNILIDWLVNPLLRVVTKLFNGLITGVISTTIQNIIKGLIDDINNRPPPSYLLNNY